MWLKKDEIINETLKIKNPRKSVGAAMAISNSNINISNYSNKMPQIIHVIIKTLN